MKHSRRVFFILLALGLILSGIAPLCAEVLWSDEGFYLDLPEGFELAGGDSTSRFAFLSPDRGLEVDLFRYDRERCTDAAALAADVLKKIGSTGETEAFTYENRPSVLAELKFSLNGASKKGYALFIEGRAAPASGRASAGQEAGGSAVLPPAKPERHTVLLAYTDESRFESYGDLVLSSLDSFSADALALRHPGPLSQYLFAFPAQRKDTKTISFKGTSIEVGWNKDEAQEQEDMAGREFRVLKAYGQNPSLWKLAWIRAYRMIYRECAASLDEFAAKIDPLLPDDPTDAARELLFWVQGFSYERDQKGSDFIAPLDSAYGARGDCDSRAMVMAILLRRRSIDSVLMLSNEYQHAMLGIDVPGGGQRFPFNKKQYLVAETTAKVGLGMIAQDQADWSKWIGAPLWD